jgi:acyl transferase domain-containing protein
LAADCFCGDIPADRWSKAKYVTKGMAAGKTPTGRGSFLDYDYRGFDPDIFALSMARAHLVRDAWAYRQWPCVYLYPR